MRIKILLVTAFLLSGIIVNAQKNFQPGYIITNSNDTVYGFIDSRGDYLNSTLCSFKEDLNEEIKVYSPGEIKAYRFNEGKFYISAYIEALDKKVFLEYLIDGIVDVFYLKETVHEYYFINKNDNRYHLLDDRETEIIQNGQRYVSKSNKYIGLLNIYMNESETVTKKIPTVQLNHKSLINLSKMYHEDVCGNEECIIFEKKPRLFRFDFDVQIHGVYSSIDYSSSKIGFIKNLEAMSCYSYELGAGVSIYTPRLNERFSLYFQLLYGTSTFSDSYNDEIYANPVKYKYKDDFSYLDRTFGIKYKIPTGFLRPEFIVGYSNTLFFDRDSYFKRETTKPDGSIDIDYPENKSYKLKSAIVFGLKANVFSFDKIDILLTAQYKHGYEIAYSNIKMRTMRAGLNIEF